MGINSEADKNVVKWVHNCLYTFSYLKMQSLLANESILFLLRRFITKSKHIAIRSNKTMAKSKDDFERAFDYLEQKYVRSEELRPRKVDHTFEAQ